MGDKQNFIDLYNELKCKDQKPAREEIIKLCGWKSSAHFYMKANGKRNLSSDEEVIVYAVLNALLKSYKIDWS